MKEITVLSPATVANVVCGFDCLGFALEEPFDRMTLRLTEEKTVRIINRDSFDLPVDPQKNVAGVALFSILEKSGADFGFEVEITKGIKPGSGIGSSSASAAGAVVGANLLLDGRFSQSQLVEAAMDGERVASGARHADNVAPAIYGGFTLVRSNDPLDVVPLEFPPLFVTVFHPQIEIKTSDAREILRQKIELRNAVSQWSNVGALVAGLQKGDYDLISRSLEDRIIEPVRRILIPHFDLLKSESLRAGALGGGISGSGPSVFMLSQTSATARKVEAAMRRVFEGSGVEFKTYRSKINPEGVKITPK
ncbi:MAG: homoserine kinase [Pyrinomonadaceae bacterium]